MLSMLIIQAPELEFIKAARYITSPTALAAWSVALMYFGFRTYSAQRKHATGSKVFIWFMGLIVIVVSLAFVMPLFGRDTTIQGVVINPKNQLPVAGAHVSIDGYPDLKFNTDADGNFQISIPSRRRQDAYTVRAQLNGAAAAVTVADYDAGKKAVEIDLAAPDVSHSVTLNIPEGMSLKDTITMIVDLDSATVRFKPGCTTQFLKTRVRAGTVRAPDYVGLIQQVSTRVVSTSILKSVVVAKLADQGIYDISCIDQK
jgi:hypothetical protein